MAAIMTSGIANAQISPVKLENPDFTRGCNVMEAFKNRHSEREFSERELSLNDLSDLLWAAYGINREDGRHTAASALNKQDVDVYVFMAKGTYLYVPAENKLLPVADGDNRNLIVGAQEGFPITPVMLLMVSETSRFEMGQNPMVNRMGAIDAALVSQNIALFCAGNGLVTVPRVSMDVEGLRKLLKLDESAMIVINNPVGYPADK